MPACRVFRLLFTVRRACFSLAFLGLVLSAAARADDGTGNDWPFTPLRSPPVPQVRDRDWGRNPLDAFVLARLEKEGLRPNPEADRLTLLKRVTFDLTGLAPTPEERAAFLADRSPDAYERLVDRLLASPHFGERWAQHWLDVVRYAETEGFKVDRIRPDAYRYRDYIIRAFNDDLPYDRFVQEQLAGDELEPDNPEALVSTGFYRLPPEESNASNYLMGRQDMFDDVTGVFGVTFLGLTFGCARCHDHKFDPITQKDYYSLQAFFAPLMQRDGVELATPEARARYERQMFAYDEATRSVRAEMEAILQPVRKQVFNELVAVFDPATQAALKARPERRTPLQRQLVSLAMKQINRRYGLVYRRLSPPQRARYEALKKKLASFDRLKPAPLPTAMAVSDLGPDAPVTHRLAGGNYLRPREEVKPAFPEFLDPTPPDIRPPAGRPRTTGRRSALARWLTKPDNPLTARVMTNRLWQHYFGQGIVATPNDFGQMGAGATHPELLDYLAAELVRQGWHLKAVHRLIVTSAAYRQASAPELNPRAEAAAKADPGNKLLWHARVKRREAEAVRDLVLQVSGQLNPRPFGPSAQPELPPEVMEDTYAWDPDPRPEDRNRRSIYVLARRNLAYPLFAAFDEPDRINSCPARANTVTAPQALVMLNGEFTTAQSRHLAARLLAKRGADGPALVRAAYLAAFGRGPTADEAADAAAFLARQEKLIAAGGPPAEETRRQGDKEIRRQGDGGGSLLVWPAPLPAGVRPAYAAAFADFCHALMNTAEFLDVQ